MLPVTLSFLCTYMYMDGTTCTCLGMYVYMSVLVPVHKAFEPASVDSQGQHSSIYVFSVFCLFVCQCVKNHLNILWDLTKRIIKNGVGSYLRQYSVWQHVHSYMYMYIQCVYMYMATCTHMLAKRVHVHVCTVLKHYTASQRSLSLINWQLYTASSVTLNHTPQGDRCCCLKVEFSADGDSSDESDSDEDDDTSMASENGEPAILLQPTPASQLLRRRSLITRIPFQGGH